MPLVTKSGISVKVSGIYKIVNNINNKLYIGSAISINNRWNTHKCELRKNKHGNKHLQSAWNKYGEESFNFEIVEIVNIIENKDFLIEREQYWIDFFNVCDRELGYNNNLRARNSLGYKHSEESKAKFRIAKAKEKHPHYGKHFSKETREKMSMAQLGKKSHLLGKKRSKETCEKISKSHKGIKLTKEHIENISKSQKGKILSKETRKKLSEKNRGENAHSCKLTENQVLEIREKYVSGNFSYSILAKEYSIARSNVASIIKRESWKHI